MRIEERPLQTDDFRKREKNQKNVVFFKLSVMIYAFFRIIYYRKRKSRA